MTKCTKFIVWFFLVFLAGIALAQAPQKFNYQAVVRDNAGNIVASQPVTFLITIRTGSPSGTDVYHETHTTTTNQFGLVNLEVGAGTLPVGTFSAIAWGSGAKYLDIDMDLGAGMVAVGVPQLISVPYALYANTANVPGVAGPTGPTGLTGPTGQTGATGPTGADGSLSAWSRLGNAGTIDGTNFIGTTDNIPFTIRVNNQRSGRLDPSARSTYLGFVAGNAATTSAYDNVVIGDSAFYASGSADNNVAVGSKALRYNSTGGLNVAMGTAALYRNTAGSGNTGIGYHALMNNTASNNVAVGSLSLSSNTSGLSNTGVGANALSGNIGGSYNTATGYSALNDNTTGEYNSAYGYHALPNNIDGERNAAYGVYSLFYCDSGSFNAAMGYGALYNNIGGNSNTALGFRSAYRNTSGRGNVAVGDSAFLTNTTGSYNTALGYRADVSATGLINATAIGANTIVSASNSVVIGNNAYVGIGISSPILGQLDVRAQETDPAVYGTSSYDEDVYGYLGGAFVGVVGNCLTRSGYLGGPDIGVQGYYDSGILGGLGYYGHGAYGQIDMYGYGFLGYSLTNANYCYHNETVSDGDGQSALYAYRTRGMTPNEGVGYAASSVNTAIKAINNYGDSYTFGVYSYTNGDYARTGGVIGNDYNVAWGSLGYYASSLIDYGVYANGGTGSGTGYMNSSAITGIGLGSYGGVMGGWARGDVLGFLTAGEICASYNLGNEFTSGYSADIVTHNGTRTAVYGVTSNEVKVYADGIGQLSGGTAQVVFDEDFARVIAREANPTVTITPTGECEGVYVVSTDATGFVVKEMRGGTSNVGFTWIAVAHRVDMADKPVLSPDLANPKFDELIKEVMFNEGNQDRSGTPIWWDGAQLRYNTPPRQVSERIPEEKTAVPQNLGPLPKK